MIEFSNTFYNAFGKFVNLNSVEHFTQEEASSEKKTIQEEKVQMIDEIKLFKKKLENGIITENEVKERMDYFRKLIKEGKLSTLEKELLEDVIENTVRKVDGINLVGNLDLNGVIKASGFYLQDGSKIKEVIKVENKLAVPLDKEGNVTIKPKEGKQVVVGGNLNVNGNLTNKKNFIFENGNNWILHNNPKAENIYLAPSETKGTKKWNFKNGTIFYRNGEVKITEGKSDNNPTGGQTHFNRNGLGINLIRGKTNINGSEFNVSTNNGINVISKGKTTTFGSQTSGWCGITTNAPKFYMNKPLQVNGKIITTDNIESNNGLTVKGGETIIQASNNEGRLRIGTPSGVPGIYSEDDKDILIGCESKRSVHFGKLNLVRIDGNGNIYLPKKANIYIGDKKITKK